VSYGRCIKTEHAGAKNGGGYWGPRIDAKKRSRKARRQNDKREVNHDREGVRPQAEGSFGSQ